MEKSKEQRYAEVILPLKLDFGEGATYLIPQTDEFKDCTIGSMVKVQFKTKEYSGIVVAIYDKLPEDNRDAEKQITYKSLLAIEQWGSVTPAEINFWRAISDYYLCSIGAVYRAAYSFALINQKNVKPRKNPEQFFETLSQTNIDLETLKPRLSAAQSNACNQIKESFESGKKPVLLHGVAGSGKTEIYVTLALEYLSKGKNVLYMVPEIALSKELQGRLKEKFGERLLTFHSGQSVAERWRVHSILAYNSKEPVVVLGTRSALFLPYKNLGLIILDEEHDSSYKQSEPAPRYHARDVAIIWSARPCSKTKVLMGSATPSLESEYNCAIGRFKKVELTEKYYGASEPKIEIVDTVSARKLFEMKGSFSQQLINRIQETLKRKKQVLVFKNRRSYSPMVECAECGEISKCPHCNVVLSYHKYNNTLSCHYCGYTAKFTAKCSRCSGTLFNTPGAGTERIEEELKELFPNASVARFDADVAKSKRMSESVIKLFSQGKTDILVGTQMIGKGFDFENLELVAILDSQALWGVQDFRADERAMQLLSQLIGRVGRRDSRGRVVIQTNNKEHPIVTYLKSHYLTHDRDEKDFYTSLLRERADFKFAPYVRMVKITFKNRDLKKVDLFCQAFESKLSAIKCGEFTGPFTPQIERLRGEWQKCFYIKLRRDKELAKNKEKIKEAVEALKCANSVIIDVDPY